MGEGRPLSPRSGLVGIVRSQPKEGAHGTIHRSGRARTELHAGGGEQDWEATAAAGRGDQRRGAEAGPEGDPRTEAALPAPEAPGSSPVPPAIYEAGIARRNPGGPGLFG